MATKDEVLMSLAGENVPLSMSQIATKMGVKPNQINTILQRMLDHKPPLVYKDDSNCYSITNDGDRELNPNTLESEELTPQKIFEGYGRIIGMLASQLPLISDYVFTGGNPNDLEWVNKALVDMSVPADKRSIWWNKWRVHIGAPVPKNITSFENQGSVSSVKEEKEKEEFKKVAEIIEWDIEAGTDLPIRVGEELGRLTHGEAVQISFHRAQAKARAAGTQAAAPPVQVDPVQQLNAIMNLVKDHFQPGQPTQQKPMIIIPKEDGGVEVKEFDSNMPMILNPQKPAPAPVAPLTWFVGPDGTARQLQPGEPIVIHPAAPAPAAQAAKTYVLHDEDGTMEEVVPGRPIVLKAKTQQSAQTQAAPYMLNAMTPDGKPFTIDIDTYFKLEDHKDKRRRDEEGHQLKQDLGKGLKELIQKGVKAAENMGADDGDSEEDNQ